MINLSSLLGIGTIAFGIYSYNKSVLNGTKRTYTSKHINWDYDVETFKASLSFKKV